MKRASNAIAGPLVYWHRLSVLPGSQFRIDEEKGCQRNQVVQEHVKGERLSGQLQSVRNVSIGKRQLLPGVSTYLLVVLLRYYYYY